MDFSGIEKLSLVDFDQVVACTLFFGGCNFRCPFCHNGDLVLNPGSLPKYPFEEILSYLKKRKGILEGVCITGGEPTLMVDLKDKIKAIKDLGYLVKLDTNGTNPELLKELIEEKLIDYVAIDIKNSEEKYNLTAGVTVDFKKVKESIDYLLTHDFPYEFRTTIVQEIHEEKDFDSIGKLIKGAPKYFLQKFVSKDTCLKQGLHSIKKEEAERFLEIVKPYVGYVSLRGYE